VTDPETARQAVQAWNEREIGNYPHAAFRGDALAELVPQLLAEVDKRWEVIHACDRHAEELTTQIMDVQRERDIWRRNLQLAEKEAEKLRSEKAQLLDQLAEASQQLDEVESPQPETEGT
jgi:chromosome segregation ATPase